MDEVNEKSTHFIDAAFTDEDGAPVTPSSGTYRIDDESPDGTCAEIKADTAFAPATPTHRFEVEPDENRILNSSKRYEVRLVTVTIVYNTNKSHSAEYRYRVKNLNKVT